MSTIWSVFQVALNMLTLPARFLLATVLAAGAPYAGASEQEIRDNIGLGALAFADNCRKCHQLDGYGEEELYPSLHDQALLANKSLLIRTILSGRLAHQETDSDGEVRLMPALDYLTDREIVAIIAFITNSWGDHVLVVTEAEVADARSEVAGNHQPTP